MKISVSFLFIATVAVSSTAQSQDLDKLFSRFDRNGDGVIDRDEMPEQARERMMRRDADGDGKISKDELTAGNNRSPGNDRAARGERPDRENRPGKPGANPGANPDSKSRPQVDRFQELLRRADKNSNGKLELNELPEPMRQRLGNLDSNGDGRIDADEMKSAMNRAGGPQGKRMNGEKRPGSDKGKGPRDGKARPQDGIGRLRGMLQELPRDEKGNIDLNAIEDERKSNRLSEFDADGDRLLDQKELQAMAEKFRQSEGMRNRERGKPGDKPMNQGDRKADRGSERSPQLPKRPPTDKG